MDKGDLQATVHGVAKESDTTERLNTFFEGEGRSEREMGQDQYWTPSKSRKRRLTVQVCEVLQGLGGCVGESGFGIGRSQGEVEGPQGR